MKKITSIRPDIEEVTNICVYGWERYSPLVFILIGIAVAILILKGIK